MQRCCKEPEECQHQPGLPGLDHAAVCSFDRGGDVEPSEHEQRPVQSQSTDDVEANVAWSQANAEHSQSLDVLLC